MSVKVTIDPIRCRGHAICTLLFSEGVELDDWGFGRVVDASPEGRDGLRRARRAAAACPNGAIVITGVDNETPRARRIALRLR
jgi:ferredoxin